MLRVSLGATLEESPLSTICGFTLISLTLPTTVSSPLTSFYSGLTGPLAVLNAPPCLRTLLWMPSNIERLLSPLLRRPPWSPYPAFKNLFPTTLDYLPAYNLIYLLYVLFCSPPDERLIALGQVIFLSILFTALSQDLEQYLASSQCWAKVCWMNKYPVQPLLSSPNWVTAFLPLALLVNTITALLTHPPDSFRIYFLRLFKPSGSSQG